MNARLAALGGLLLVSIALLMMPFDIQVAGWIRRIPFPGDIEKDLQAFQQFGQLGVLILVVFLVWRLEPPNIRRTLLDLGVAVAIAIIIATVLKTVLGRIRPGHAEWHGFLGPMGMRSTDNPLHDDWHATASMPSSHATAAAVLAVYLAWIQPRITWIAAILAGLVAFVRVHAGAHFPSDVLAGLLLGGFTAAIIIPCGWGCRLLDWYWKRVVDTSAQPAWPEVREFIRQRHLQVRTPRPPWWARWRGIVGLAIIALGLLTMGVIL
ncbi:MAG: phosphatase PAP2 family protein [Phycisphaerales bacterium]|nr:phosphatase PAP2 family protein [Phycisphaerales bacterium]